MGLVYKQLTRQIVSNKIFTFLLLLLTMLTSLSFFFVKFSVDGNREVLKATTFLSENQKLYKTALQSNSVLANLFLFSLTTLTAFVFLMFFYRFFRENKKLIGCIKSLGFKDFFLRIYFVVFVAILSTMGSLLGLAGGYYVSNILTEANKKTYAVTGLIRVVNSNSLFLGLVITTVVFCLVTFLSYSFIDGREPAVLLGGEQNSKGFSGTLRIANRIVAMIPVKNRFPLRIALRKPVAVLMIFAGTMAFNVCMILGYSLNISSKEVFHSQTIGHNYNYDAHFSGYCTQTVSADAMRYLDYSTTISVNGRNVLQTVIGIYNRNAVYELQDKKGNYLTVPDRGSIYMNPGLAEIYDVAVGDTLIVTILGTKHNFTVAEIAANAKSASVYVNADQLTEIMDIPAGSYNGILSMDRTIDSERLITKSQRIESLNRNAVSNKSSAVINQVIGIITGAILLFLALLINFQENTRDILILNRMGYHINGIKKLLIDVYMPIIWFSYSLTIVPSILTAFTIQKSLSISIGDYMPFGINWNVILSIFIILNIIYHLIESIFVLGIRNIIAKEKITEYMSI